MASLRGMDILGIYDGTHDAGAAVVRVHDVAASRQFLDVLAAIGRD